VSKKRTRKDRRFQAVRRLEDVEILVEEPCTVLWRDMKGDGLVRKCYLCNFNVYDFAGMHPDQILALINQHEGKLCAQFYARSDGTMTMESCDGDHWNHLIRGGLIVSQKPEAEQPPAMIDIDG
jgi:hypothetical protein